jgi:hypothetical protein
MPPEQRSSSLNNGAVAASGCFARVTSIAASLEGKAASAGLWNFVAKVEQDLPAPGRVRHGRNARVKGEPGGLYRSPWQLNFSSFRVTKQTGGSTNKIGRD